jgi:hypothetical protein
VKYAVFSVTLMTTQGALACATCSGPADAPQSQGMNAAILTLFCVLGMVAIVFFSFVGAIALRIARHHAHELAQGDHVPQPFAGVES